VGTWRESAKKKKPNDFKKKVRELQLCGELKSREEDYNLP